MENNIFCHQGLQDLVKVYQQRDDLDQTEQALRLLIKTQENLCNDKNHPSVITSKAHLALVLKKNGDLVGAEAVTREILAQRTDTLGIEHVETIKTICNLSVILNARGNVADGENYGRLALDLSVRVLGKENIVTLSCQNNMAVLLNSRCKFVEAESIYRRSLTCHERLLGLDNATVLTCRFNLATFLKNREKAQYYPEAEELYRNVLSGREKLFGVKHTLTLAVANNLVTVLKLQNKLKESEEICAVYVPSLSNKSVRTTKDKSSLSLSTEARTGISSPDLTDRKSCLSVSGGLTIQHLQCVREFIIGCGLQHLSVRHFVFQVVQPFSMMHDCSIHDYITGRCKQDSSTLATPIRRRKYNKLCLDFCAPADAMKQMGLGQDEKERVHYMCYAWDGNLVEVLDSLINFDKESELIPEAKNLFWFDIFMTDHRSYCEADMSVSAMLRDLGTIIPRSDRLLFIVPDVSNAIALTRTWCLWELYVAITSNVPVVTLSKKVNPDDSLQSRLEKVNMFVKQVYDIDVNSSICGSVDERGCIVRSLPAEADGVIKAAILTLSAVKISDIMKMMAVNAQNEVLESCENHDEFSEFDSTHAKADNEDIYHLVVRLRDLRKQFGPKHSDTLKTATKLAGLLLQTGQTVRATELLEDLFKSILGQGISDALNVSQGRIKLMESVWREDESLVHACQQLAAIYQARGAPSNLHHAEELLKSVLAVLEKRYGRNHPKSLFCKGNMGRLMAVKGKVQDAVRMCQDAYSALVKLGKSKIPDFDIQEVDLPEFTAQSAFNLSTVLVTAGKFMEAWSTIEQVIRWRTQKLGELNPSTLSAVLLLASIHRHMHRFREAEEIYDRVLSVKESSLGADHEEVRNVLVAMAMCKREAGQTALAEVLYRRVAVSSMRHAEISSKPSTPNFSPPGSVRMASPVGGEISKLSTPLMSPPGDLTPVGNETLKASMSPQENTPIVSSVRGEAVRLEEIGLATLSSCEDAIHALYAVGRLQEAEALCRQLIEFLRLECGPGTESSHEYHQNLKFCQQLALILRDQKEREGLEEACKLLHFVISKRTDLLGGSHPDTIDAKNHLAGILRLLERNLDAEHMYREVLQYRRENFGDEDPHTLTTMVTMILNLKRTVLMPLFVE
jgi:tetratricopeptide (TPR) repeat protein